MIKDLKLEISICFKSPIIEHWTPLHQTPHILLIPLSNWEIFAPLEALGERLKLFFQLQNQESQCVMIQPQVWVLMRLLANLSTLLKPNQEEGESGGGFVSGGTL
jgi:hypothetical protein